MLRSVQLLSTLILGLILLAGPARAEPRTVVGIGRVRSFAAADP